MKIEEQTIQNIDQLIDVENKKVKALKKIRYHLKQKSRYNQDTLWYYEYPKSELTKLMMQDIEEHEEVFGETPVWAKNVPITYAMIDWIAIQHGKWNKAHGIQWDKAILTCNQCRKTFPTEQAHDRYHQELLNKKVKVEN